MPADDLAEGLGIAGHVCPEKFAVGSRITVSAGGAFGPAIHGANVPVS